MVTHDAGWAVQQYEAVRHLLPDADMPSEPVRAEHLGEIAHQFDVFLLDAFGVLNVGNSAISGAAERVKQLQDMGKRVLVLTNGARHPAEQALKKFLRFGFDFVLSDIVSSRDALTNALKNRPQSGFWGAMCAKNSQMETFDIPWRRLEDDPSVYDAACGFLLVSSAEWSDAQQALLQESLTKSPRPILVGNPDIVAPREYGLSLEPGYYAYNLIRQLDLEAQLFGKPFGNIFDLAFKRTGQVDLARVVMIGDTLHTDVLGGAAYGVRTALVTDYGLFSNADHWAFIAQTNIVPDYIMPSI